MIAHRRKIVEKKRKGKSIDSCTKEKCQHVMMQNLAKQTEEKTLNRAREKRIVQ
tara:strand:+ start:1950 stop:2111 length:162 start_codon:yes stop_codon:yes gene_type:complete